LQLIAKRNIQRSYIDFFPSTDLGNERRFDSSVFQQMQKFLGYELRDRFIGKLVAAKVLGVPRTAAGTAIPPSCPER